MTKRKRKDTRHYVDSIENTSRTVDLDAIRESERDENVWWWECRACEECGAIETADSESIFYRHEDHDVDECAACADHDCKIASCPLRDRDEIHAEGPMMSYFWPCDWQGDEFEIARALVDLPLIPGLVGDERGFFLTGGGQDLSWEIAGAYVAVGHYPPATLTLPMDCRRLDGAHSLRWLEIAEALFHSYETLRGWCEQRHTGLTRTLGDLRDYTRKRRDEDKARKAKSGEVQS